jgi:hypothetical protein
MKKLIRWFVVLAAVAAVTAMGATFAFAAEGAKCCDKCVCANCTCASCGADCKCPDCCGKCEGGKCVCGTAEACKCSPDGNCACAEGCKCGHCAPTEPK